MTQVFGVFSVTWQIVIADRHVKFVWWHIATCAASGLVWLKAV
jgi:hypothetical protein